MKFHRTGKMPRWLPFGLSLVALALLFSSAGQAEEPTKGAFLGVYLKDLDEDTRAALKFGESGGAFVDGVVEDGPAEEAGLKDGDVITGFNGKPVKDAADLRALIQETKSGDQVAVAVYRDQENRTFTVRMGESDDLPEITIRKEIRMMRPFMKMRGGCEGCGDCPWMGVELLKLTDQLADYFKVKDGEGVLISSVEKDSPAAKAGLKAGDVLVKVGDESVENRAEVRQALCGHKAGDEIAVEVVRAGKKQTLKVQLAKAPEKYRSCVPMMKGGCCGGKGILPRHLENLDLYLEALPEALPEHLEDIEVELDEPLKELQRQIDELRDHLRELENDLEQKK